MKKLAFIHTVSNTPYKHYYYNLLSSYYNVYVIQLADKSKGRDWENLRDKKYNEYVIHHGYINLRNIFSSCLRVIRLLKSLDPDIIISHGYHRVEFILAPLFFTGKIKICETATTYPDHKRFAVKELFKSFLLKSTFDYFLVYGKLAKDYLSNNLSIKESKIFIRGNFSHLQLSNSNSKPISERPKTLLYIGRLAEEKNLFVLINAFQVFKQNETNDWKLKIVGGGPLLTLIKKHIINCNLEMDIELIAHTTPVQLKEFYSDASAFVLPSVSEPWGQVINEAMHFGLPIIISRNCGVVEDLCKDNAVTFNPENVNELAEIFKNLLTNTNKLTKMGKRSSDIIETYKPHTLIQRQVDFLNSIIETKGR